MIVGAYFVIVYLVNVNEEGWRGTSGLFFGVLLVFEPRSAKYVLYSMSSVSIFLYYSIFVVRKNL